MGFSIQSRFMRDTISVLDILQDYAVYLQQQGQEPPYDPVQISTSMDWILEKYTEVSNAHSKHLDRIEIFECTSKWPVQGDEVVKDEPVFDFFRVDIKGNIANDSILQEVLFCQNAPFLNRPDCKIIFPSLEDAKKHPLVMDADIKEFEKKETMSHLTSTEARAFMSYLYQRKAQEEGIRPDIYVMC